MLEAWVMTLIFTISAQEQVPPYLVAAIIIVESQGNPNAINRNNANNTIDLGIMQLNSSWFNDPNWACAETNIRAGTKHLRWLYTETYNVSPTWWVAVVAYNCGLSRFNSQQGPPQVSIAYADRVMELWKELDPILRRQNRRVN